MRRFIVFSAAVAALAGCAPSAGPVAGAAGLAADAGARPCCRPSLVRNVRTSSDQTLYVRTSNDDVFQIDAAFCRDMTSALSIVLEPTAGSSSLCVNDQARLRMGGVEPCRVRVVKKLSAEELAALPSRDRP